MQKLKTNATLQSELRRLQVNEAYRYHRQRSHQKGLTNAKVIRLVVRDNKGR